ncbi:hypothetical protein, variant 1 [Phytophthora nicotianae]|uniref:Uncharacterized protein n=2 Tax=Phytophthora nicotianae TaxID=4792 RepID=W2GPK4_PHYNI|nr:hypothetical protein L915_10793 [Phytophthora nicotianae]ETO72870.1 hypothetical protein F444_11145 [Phytophthora nicotianae P1976]ETK84236.1 hypothetical protein, variant 1 [Phytophthora nicotianae]ETL90821.1 hypothetical protein L917_10582 [Phytophthora nicotianae]ETL90822.1 hypothetical protein, variant 1 [Phytophthora nicotianae]
MSSNFTRDATVPSSTSAQSSTATVTSSSTTTTTTATASTNPNANANNSSTSPSGSSPSSSGDGNGRPGNAQQSSGSDGSSPMRRLPTVLRAPPGANSGTPSNATSAPVATAASTTRSQTQAQAAQQQGQSQSHSAINTATAGNRDITGMGRRHMYPSQALASPYGGSGAPSPAQMQPQYFGSEGGRITTASSSYNHDHLSPVSSPAMGESWASAGNMANRGLKRHLPQQYDGYSRAGSSTSSIRMPQQQPAMQNTASATQSGARRGPNSRSPTMQMYGMPPNEDPMQYEPSGEARHPRDSTRYETWTSKQLRKKCSHLKLRGLKNVKKHVMVEALYRYYRNQRLKDMADAASAEKISAASQQISSPQPPQQRRMDARRPSSISGSSVSGGRPDMQYPSRYDQRNAGPTQSQYGPYNSRSRSYSNYGSQSPSPPSSGGDSASRPQRAGPKSNSNGYYLDEESKGESQYKEVPVTSEDVIRLVDVVLSPEFVDRLSAELSRWQFWVDVREMYIALLNRQHPPGSAGANGEGGPVGTGGSATNSRNFKWSSMQLWEIWKELSFAYTKTCFEFTAAGMNKRVDDREYINFCDGRPDVYYLHQRLHLRPDLLHLIKSNEYIDEKCTSDASETIAHEQQQAQQQQQAGPLVGTGSPLLRAHKRYKRSTPMAAGSASTAYNSARAIAAFRNGNADGSGAANGGNSGDNGLGQGSGDSRGHSPEENSTENSETTGEEASSNTANSNASNSSQDVSMRAALAEQKYFGLLLQNFEVIFESLHNKKVLLATLRKDSKAPDHLIADLHDDIHVLSALKKEFRNKLRRTIQ